MPPVRAPSNEMVCLHRAIMHLCAKMDVVIEKLEQINETLDEAVEVGFAEFVDSDEDEESLPTISED